MFKKVLLAMGLFGLALGASAQMLKDGYVRFPESAQLHTYITNWKNNSYKVTTVGGAAWEDENFFISRVKPRAPFVNTATQVYPTRTEAQNKRLIWWVPCNEAYYKDCQTDGLPNGRFDSEVFSTWSYITHWGDWIAPHGWVPGSLADAAHKNGVAVSGVASIPWGSISSNWQTCLQGMNALNPNDVGAFLYYHGVDGLGYNSEFNGSRTLVDGSRNLHDNLMVYMKDRNPIFENIWYGGTTDSGSTSFDSGLSYSTGIFKGASIFLNYNYGSASYLSGIVSQAPSVTDPNGKAKSGLYVYAGNNMQGGEPRSGNNWGLLKDYNVSIGLWGAHRVNMFWQDRNGKGSSLDAMQNTYQLTCEQWFGNGPRNPAVKITAFNKTNHRPDDKFCGMSSMISARSAIKWAIATEPFVTYFNLGNGKFFNWRGARENNNEWYNIGIQDYLPTWRFWFAPTLLQNTVTAGTTGMDAKFVWDDAWFGGSSLQVSGTATKEYLHLFKTCLSVANGQKVTFRYKVLEGEADMSLICTFGNHESTEKVFGKVITAANCEDAIDKGYNKGEDGWMTFTYEFKTAFLRNMNDVDGNTNLSMLGLKFENAKNFKVLLGELSITPSAATATPKAPVIASTKVLCNNFQGVDGKIIFNMPDAKAAPLPTYNSDVNVSMFRLWSQEEGAEPKLVGVTTSWAAILFRCSNVNPDARIRFGVSALATDHKTESAIAWGSYLAKGAYETSNDIVINKSIIKPGEDFEISYVDPNHTSSAWEIRDASNNLMFSGNGKGIKVTSGMPAIGFYDLKVTDNGGTVHNYPKYVAVSGVGVGALPKITSLTINNKAVSEETTGVKFNVGDRNTFGYVGRQADGSASRGIDLNENWFGVPLSELGIQGYQSFTIAGWVKYNSLPEGLSNFITIENRAGAWPQNNWGFFWSRITGEGKFIAPNIDTAWGMRTQESGTEGKRVFYRWDDAKIDEGAWTHVAVVFDFDAGAGKVRQHFYINGQKQRVGVWCDVDKTVAENTMVSDWSRLEMLSNKALKYETNTYNPDYGSTERTLHANDWLSFGGSAHEITAVQGCVDDFIISDRVMTQEQVLEVMNGVDPNNLPSYILAYWDFEGAPAADFSFPARGRKAGAKAYWYTMQAQSGEGQSLQTPQEASFLSGSPFISGTAYPIVTTPTWSARKADISGTGNDKAGSADITFNSADDKIVTLKLENGHGSDVRSYPVLQAISSVEAVGVDSADFQTYTIDDSIFVEFAEDGDYTVTVYNMAGMIVGQHAANFVAGQNICVTLDNAGVYIVRVNRDGKELRAVKVIVK